MTMPAYEVQFTHARRTHVYHLVGTFRSERTFCSRPYQNWSIHDGKPSGDLRLCRQCHRTLNKERVIWQRLDLENPAD